MRKKITLLVAAALALSVPAVAEPFGSADSAGAATKVDPDALGMRTNSGFLRLDRLNHFEQQLGQQVKWHVAMADKGSPSLMRSSVWGQMRAPGAALPQISNRMNLVMTVPLTFGNATAHTTAGKATIRKTLLATANGAHDADYRVIARNMVAGGYPDAVIRLGHEFSGPFYPWSSQGNEDAYIAAFRHVQKVLQSESQRFRFEWNAARNTWTKWGPPAYPGDAYVDIIGIDIYYEPWKGDNPDFNDELWDRRYLKVLDNHRDFAAARGKSVSYAEWANGNVDQPKFIEKMHGWFASLPRTGAGSLEYHAYFSASRNEYNLDRYPKTNAAFMRLFGSNGPAVSGGGGDTAPPVVTTPAPAPNPAPPEPTPTPTPTPTGSVPSIEAPGSVATATGTAVRINSTVNAQNVVWWKVSGPGAIQWADRKTESPTVKMNRAGTYTLKVRATQGLKRTTATVNVVVGGNATGNTPTNNATSGSSANGSQPRLTIRDASTREGKSLPFRIELSAPAPAPVTITVRTSDGTAKARTDYRPRTVEVTIPKGERRVWVGVGTIKDGRNESTETVTMTVTKANGATIATGKATGRISD